MLELNYLTATLAALVHETTNAQLCVRSDEEEGDWKASLRTTPEEPEDACLSGPDGDYTARGDTVVDALVALEAVCAQPANVEMLERSRYL